MALGLGLSLGLALMLSLLVGLASAQGPERSGGTMPAEPEIEARWLILDTARPLDETLPSLLEALTALKAGGGVLDFDPTPRSGGPAGVPGLWVMALPDAWSRLCHLPGVLTVDESLPPPSATSSGPAPLFHASAVITGRVTESDGGTPLTGVQVQIYDAVSYAQIGGMPTDANGYYSTTVAAPFDQAKVRFEHPQYAVEWYNGKYYFAAADAVDLAGGGTVTGINGSLEKVGVVSATVRFEGTGDPVPATWMDVFGVDGSRAGSCRTDPNGQCVATSRAGAYKLYFQGHLIAPEWYQDKTSQRMADTVTVTAGQTTTVNATVAPAGWITGVVTDDSTGLPVPIMTYVFVHDQSLHQAGFGMTDLSGNYAIGGLDTGHYKVCFLDFARLVGQPFYHEQYYDDKPGWDQADLVAVTAGITTPNINAALTPITPLGTVTGTIEEVWTIVRSPLDPGENVHIYFYDSGSGTLVYDHHFWGDGSTTLYTVSLPADTYKVLFTQDKAVPDYAPKWYDSKTSYASADVITVTAGATTTDVNALLPMPWLGSRGCISGVVTAAVDGTRLPDVEVRVYAGYAENYHHVKTNADGEYEICNLLHDYQVQFVRNPYLPQWYSGAAARTDATTVTVSPGATVTNVNAALDLGGCISGRITDPSGLLRPSAWGRVFDSSGERTEFHDRRWLTDILIPDEDASFVACGLPAGDYVVQCREDSLSGSVPVTVIAGQETSGVMCVVARRLYLPLILRDY